MDPFVFGCLVFGSGATMMGLHWDANFRQKYKDNTDEEVDFFKRQYRRRMIASGMITLVGVLFMVYRLIPERSLIRVWLIGIVLILVGCIVVLGMFDFSSISQIFAMHNKEAGSAAKELADELARQRKKIKDKNEDQVMPEETREEEPTDQ